MPDYLCGSGTRSGSTLGEAAGCSASGPLGTQRSGSPETTTIFPHRPRKSNPMIMASRGRCSLLLDEIPHRRLMRGVVMVRTQDAGRVSGLLRSVGTEIHARRVELTEGDRAVLQGL